MQTLQTKQIADFEKKNPKEQIAYLLEHPTELYKLGILNESINRLKNQLHLITGQEKSSVKDLINRFNLETPNLAARIESNIATIRQKELEAENLRIYYLEEERKLADSKPKITPSIKKEPSWLERSATTLAKIGRKLIAGILIIGTSFLGFKYYLHNIKHQKLIETVENIGTTAGAVNFKDAKSASDAYLTTYILFLTQIQKIEKIQQTNQSISVSDTIDVISALRDYNSCLQSYLALNKENPMVLAQTKVDLERTINYILLNEAALGKPTEITRLSIDQVLAGIYFNYVRIEIYASGKLSPLGKGYLKKFEDALIDASKKQGVTYKKEKLDEIKKLTAELE
jgi:hypothetical protein